MIFRKNSELDQINLTKLGYGCVLEKAETGIAYLTIMKTMPLVFTACNSR